MKICPAVLELNHVDRQTYGQINGHGQPYMHSVHVHRAKNKNKLNDAEVKE
jgi:hypothetical protein